MTTMDSDSESQDSDEGRRFRFEATRKDATASLQSRRQRTSPSRTNSERRSRSRDRFNRERRDAERSRYDYKKESRSSSISRRTSKERETNQRADQRDNRYLKDANESTRSGSRYRDSKDTKSLSNHKDPKDLRESLPKSSRKDSRTRERERRRSHERSIDRSYDDKIQTEKYTNKFRDRNKRHSRERSRERSNQGSRSKIVELEKFRDESSRKLEFSRKISRKDDGNDKTVKNSNLLEKPVGKNIVDSGAKTKSRSSSPSVRQECKDLNLSDFDIVSDTEGNCSDSSGSGRATKGSLRKVGENSLPNEFESRIKKRVSKQQYERLLKRQEVKNRRNLEELHKVNPKNGDHLPGPSNNNRSAVSDFLLLGQNVSPSASSVLSANIMDEFGEFPNETNKSNNNKKDAIDSDSDNSQSSSAYGPALPPKISRKSDVRCDETNEKEEIAQPKRSEKSLNCKEEAPNVPRIIGPSLPVNFRQSNENIEMEADDTFGPALPPHLVQPKSQDSDPEEESIGPALSGNKSGKYQQTTTTRSESETEDDDMLGPLPADHPALENDLVQRQLELRARRLKAELAECDREDDNKREEWMTELPPAKAANLGLGPRKFRVRPAPDMSDRSSWTDTPADRVRKQREMLENKQVCEPTISAEREAIDDESSERERSKKRQKSLMEIHQKKLHKKKKKEEKEAKKVGKPIRRPFDRDVDLQANRFDEARKKSMFLKARELDDRFSRGKI